MEPRPKLVLVTGGTGHVGAKIIDELLKDGYSVRVTAQPHKVDTLKKLYPNTNGQLKAVEMADLVLDAGKWPEILKGVDMVIHVACAVYHPGITSGEVYNLIVDPKSSVKCFILTGSISVFFNPDFSSLMDETTYSQKTYSEIEAIDPKKHILSYAYIASKITSEKLPQIEFTTILPSTVCGWFLEDYLVPKTIPELNTNKFLYGLIPPTTEFPSFPVYPLRDIVHNLDIARPHIHALTVPAPPNGERRRFIVSRGPILWVEAIEFLQELETIVKFKANLAECWLPEAIISRGIVSRLPDISKSGMQSGFNMDASLTETVLGMKVSNYISWKDILLEVMPHLMAWEEMHKKALH
ncbi:hypothetical protein B0H14DRAFT_3029790, partial [Mycena olivaceomarginata]